MAFVALVAALFAASAPVSQAEEPEPAPPPIPEAAPAVARAAWTWSVNEEGVFRSWEDNGETPARREDLTDGMNRLFGIASRGRLEMGAQLDIAFASPAERAALTQESVVPPPGATTSVFFYDRDQAKHESAVVLEKKFIRWRGERLSLEAGDTYHALGRGLALALVRNTELDIDTSLEGALLQLDAGPFESVLFGGYSNPQTVATAFSNHLRRDARDEILGGRVALSGPVTVFAHGAWFNQDPEAPAQMLLEGELYEARRARAVGGGVSLPDLGDGLADVYFEGIGLSIDGKSGSENAVQHDGYGAYAVANLYAGSVTVTLEGKSYVNLELLNTRQTAGAIQYDYSTAPTLEKENVVNYNLAKAVNSNDVHGGRANVAFPISQGLLGRLTFLRLNDLGHRSLQGNGEILDENERIEHVYGTLERRKESSFLQVTAGARNETRMANPDAGDVLFHVDGDFLAPLFWEGGSVELKQSAYRQTEESVRTGIRRTSDITSTTLSVSARHWLTVAGLVDTTTDSRTISGIGARPGNLSDQAFGAVEITMRPTERSTARLFAGATQGGLKCSGGTCRVVPAFEGVRVEWVARY